MGASIKSDSQRGGAQLGVVGGETMITDTPNRYGIYAGSVAITVAVVICKTSIAGRPNVDVTFTATTLRIIID